MVVLTISIQIDRSVERERTSGVDESSRDQHRHGPLVLSPLPVEADVHDAPLINVKGHQVSGVLVSNETCVAHRIIRELAYLSPDHVHGTPPYTFLDVP